MIMNNHLFVKGVFVLMLGGIAVKILGAIYRIPLTWIIGTQGLGMYQLVYPVFSLLLVLSSTGAPTAISTMVADRVSRGRYQSAKQVLKVSIIILLTTGLIIGVLFACASGVLAMLQNNPSLNYLYLCLSLAIPLVAVLSAYRGYFQGFMNMTPTATSQIIEQLSKLVFGLGLAWLLSKKGIMLATLGAVLGVVVGELFAVLYILTYYLRHKNVQNQSFLQNDYQESTKSIVKEFFANSLPIVLCSFVLPLLQMIDSLLVIKLLMVGGVDPHSATNMWGICSGIVGSLVNLPVALTLAIAVTIAPNVRNANDTKQQTISKIAFANNLSINISLPLSVLLCCLAGVVVPFLYQHTINSAQDVALAVSLLMLNAPFILIISLVQVQNAALQGLKKSKKALSNIIIAGVFKLIILVLLTTNSQIGIYGVVISNIALYLVAFLLNSISLRKNLMQKISIKASIGCIISSFVMGVFVFVGSVAFGGLSVYWQLPLLLVIGLSVYLSTLWAVGGLSNVTDWLKNIKSKVYNRAIK